MSTLRPCNMRGPRLKTLLFLLLLLLTALTRTAFCQDEDDSDSATEGEETNDTEIGEEDGTVTSELPTDPDAATPSENIPIGDSEGIPTTDKPEGSGAIPDNVDPSASDSTPPPDEVNEDGDLSPIIILIPVVLVVVIIGMIVSGIFINRKWNNKARNQELRKEDPYLDGPSTEKVPMPMFEEDVPSVLELEMEELDQWMKKDGDAAEDSKQA